MHPSCLSTAAWHACGLCDCVYCELSCLLSAICHRVDVTCWICQQSTGLLVPASCQLLPRHKPPRMPPVNMHIPSPFIQTHSHLARRPWCRRQLGSRWAGGLTGARCQQTPCLQAIKWWYCLASLCLWTAASAPAAAASMSQPSPGRPCLSPSCQVGSRALTRTRHYGRATCLLMPYAVHTA